MTKTIWLKEGTVVKFQCGQSGGTYSKSGSTLTVRGGEPSKLWFNGNLQAQAGGGQGVVNSELAPSGVTAVKLFFNNNASSDVYPVHWHTGSDLDGSGCYFKEEWWYRYFRPQWHFGPVDSYHNDSAYDNGHAGCYMFCTECGDSSPLGQMPDCHAGVWTNGTFFKYHGVGEPPVDGASNGSNHKYFLGCGYSDGQILGTPIASVGISVDNWICDSASQSNTGAGKFSIQLVEQNNLQYSNRQVATPMWRNNRVHVMVMEYETGEHYVTYVKHGNF